MKKTFFLIVSCILLYACNSDDDAPVNPIDQLPPATQTGAGTFGCLVNGKAFVETGTYFNCYYQLVDGGYYFSISAEDEGHDLLRAIVLASNSAVIEENNAYDLDCNTPTSYYSEIVFENSFSSADTCESPYGILQISKFDVDSNVVSGTFEFDIVNPNTGNIIEIRNGRFDTMFTQ